MRAIRVLPAVVTALLLGTSVLPAQDAYDEFMRQSEILEQDLDSYVAAREREQEAVRELRDLNTQLSNLLADPNASVSEMRRVESRIATATDRAYRSLQETARARAPIYDQMDRLAALARQVRDDEPAPINEDNPQGLWEFRFEPIGIHALVDLSFQMSGLNQGYTAIGTYRSSSGRHGDLRGTYVGDRLELQIVDSREGQVATMFGRVGFEGDVQGTWKAVRSGLIDLPSNGSWTGRRVASASEVDLN